MGKALSKAGIVAELSIKTGLAKPDVGRLLAELTELVYREAAGGLTLPGLCKFKLVRRKESRRYNPVTKSHLQIAAHDVLKIVPLKKAREVMAPIPSDLIIRVIPPEETAAARRPSVPALENTENTPAPAAPMAASAPADETGAVIFACPHCGNTIMAQFKDRGKAAECPVCNGRMLVPESVAAGAPADSTSAAAAAPKPSTVSNFVTFVCDACGQEIEAPLEMIGMDADCPSCGSQLRVPTHESPIAAEPGQNELGVEAAVDRSTMTIRMDLSDLAI